MQLLVVRSTYLQPQMLGEIFVRHLDKHTPAFRFIVRTVVFLSSPGRLERSGPVELPAH